MPQQLDAKQLKPLPHMLRERHVFAAGKGRTVRMVVYENDRISAEPDGLTIKDRDILIGAGLSSIGYDFIVDNFFPGVEE